MTIRQLLLTVTTVFMLSIGQVLFKLASEKIDIHGKGFISGFLLNPALLIAILVYGLATISWLFVLKITPLKIAYPFAALAFIIVPIFAFYFLGEPLRWTTFAGAAIIVAGVYVSLL
jgi:drug/metabolite transporter (DMT)-like permease